MDPEIKSGGTFNADIYIAGDLAAIKAVCRKYTYRGDVCLIARDEGLVIKSEVIPWRSATAVAEEIMRMVEEWR